MPFCFSDAMTFFQLGKQVTLELLLLVPCDGWQALTTQRLNKQNHGMLTPDRILHIHPFAQTPCELRGEPCTAMADGPIQRVGETRDSEAVGFHTALHSLAGAPGSNSPLATISPPATEGGHLALLQTPGEAGLYLGLEGLPPSKLQR